MTLNFRGWEQDYCPVLLSFGLLLLVRWFWLLCVRFSGYRNWPFRTRTIRSWRLFDRPRIRSQRTATRRLWASSLCGLSPIRDRPIRRSSFWRVGQATDCS